MLPIIIAAKVGIKSCRFAVECVHIDVTGIVLHEHTQILASAACRVGGQQFLSWIASFLFPYFVLWSLLPFKFFINLGALSIQEASEALVTEFDNGFEW